MLALTGLCLVAGPAVAVNQVVTSLADSGAGSLRQAILDVHDGGTITISVTGVISLTSARLSIRKRVTITGPGADVLTVERSSAAGTPGFGIFYLVNNSADNGAATISGLTIRNGFTDPISGGAGVLLLAAEEKRDEAILNLENCVIRDCFTFGQGGGVKIEDGHLTMRGCSILNNRADGSQGGGVSALRSETVFEHCTFHGNVADTAAGLLLNDGPARITSCTIAGNPLDNVDDDGSSCLTLVLGSRGEGVLTIGNTILQSAISPFRTWDAMRSSGPVISQGFNICSDDGLGLTGPADQLNTSALNGTPSDHGGPVPTIALEAGSPALDQGNAFGFSEDQRGLPRPRDSVLVANAPAGDGSDVGAYELQDYPQLLGLPLFVTTTHDHDDGVAGAVDCTLREALRTRETLLTDGVAYPIFFAPEVFGLIALNNNLGPLPAIRQPTHLIGPGARTIAITGELGVRPILQFANTISNRQGVSLVSGLTLRSARGTGLTADGAGVLSLIAAGSPGMVRIQDCAFTDNVATTLSGSQPGQAGGTARGGAIFNSGPMILERCSFKGNSANGGSSLGNNAQFAFGPVGGGGLGGAIYNAAGAHLTLRHCSFANNIGTGGNGANNTGNLSADGPGGPATGAIHNLGTVVMAACTLSGNTAEAGAGGGTEDPGAAGGSLTNAGGTFQIGGTLCAGNSFTVGSPSASGHDVLGGFLSSDWNLVGRATGGGGFAGAHDQFGTNAAPLNPLLGVFQNNGGAGDTFLLLSGSPALDRGHAFSHPTEQRRLRRTYDQPALANPPGGDGTDIGAVEMQPVPTGPAAFVAIESPGTSPRLTILTLQGAIFTDYQLEASPALLSGTFADLGKPQITDINGLTTFIVPADYGTFPVERYFRARKLP